MRKLSNDELGRIQPEEFQQAEKHSITVILENVRSALNVGSVFRSCDAFKIEKIILCGFTATPPNKEIHKTALGATETVVWEYYPEIDEAITHLKNLDYKIFSVEQTENSVMLDKFSPQQKQKLAFVFGNEVSGVEQTTIVKSHAVIEIPQYGTKHSLNIAVCAGIVLWHSIYCINSSSPFEE